MQQFANSCHVLEIRGLSDFKRIHFPRPRTHEIDMEHHFGEEQELGKFSAAGKKTMIIYLRPFSLVSRTTQSRGRQRRAEIDIDEIGPLLCLLRVDRPRVVLLFTYFAHPSIGDAMDDDSI